MKVGEQNLAGEESNRFLLPDFDPLEIDEDLVDWPGSNIKIHSKVLTPLTSLVEKANANGFDMRMASGFRSFERQLFIWNNKANGSRAVLDEAGMPIDLEMLTDDEKVYAILHWSALPGASRHHWGTDIDVYDASRMPENYQLQLTTQETEGDGPFAEFHCWLSQELTENPQDFCRPYVDGVGSVSPEPWHLSYAPLARQFAAQLTEHYLREKIQSVDIALKESVLKNLSDIYQRYVKPYEH